MNAAIIQARMGSTRLPGKVMRQIICKPMIQHVLERTARAKYLDLIVVAIPEQDIVLYNFLQKLTKNIGNVIIIKWLGDEDDVLGRYYYTVENIYGIKVVVRITADCPLVCPEVIDEAILMYTRDSYITSREVLPSGFDVEVFSADDLRRANNNNIVDKYTREHVTTWLQEQLLIERIKTRKEYGVLAPYHLSVDTIADFERVEKIFKFFSHNWFNLQDIIEFYKKRRKTWTIK